MNLRVLYAVAAHNDYDVRFHADDDDDRRRPNEVIVIMSPRARRAHARRAFLLLVEGRLSPGVVVAAVDFDAMHSNVGRDKEGTEQRHARTPVPERFRRNQTIGVYVLV